MRQMRRTGRFFAFVRQQDWRIWFGVVVTIIWMTGGIWFVTNAVRSNPEQGVSLGIIGSFLEGAFAPLAFLWLVLGLFIQQSELARNTVALQRTLEQSEKQTQAIAATEMNARQETFFKIAENVNKQLGGISGMLLMSGLGPNGSGQYSREQMDDLFDTASNGDYTIFERQFLTADFLEEGGLGELLYGTEIRHRHTHNFCRTFERLVSLAEGCDVDGIITDTLKQTAFGLLYRRMMDNQPEFSAQAAAET